MLGIWVASFGGALHAPVTTYFQVEVGASTVSWQQLPRTIRWILICCFPLCLRLRLATLVSSARWVFCWCRLFMDGFWIGTLHTPRRHLTLKLKFCTSRVLGRRGFVGPLKASLVSPVLLELSSPLAAGCSDESRCCRHFAVPSAAFSMALHRMSWDFTWRAWCLHSAQ